MMFLRRVRKFSGMVFLGWVIGYGIVRPIIEMYRDDDQRGAVGPLSTSQFIGVVSVAAGIALLVHLFGGTGKTRRACACGSSRCPLQPARSKRRAATGPACGAAGQGRRREAPGIDRGRDPASFLRHRAGPDRWYKPCQRGSMSLKRSHGTTRSSFGGSDAGAKVGRQELYDELRKMQGNNQSFTPVDVALSIGAGEPQVSRALLGLAAEGCLEKIEVGKYRVAQSFAELSMPEFLKTFTRASKTDSTRQRDLSEIARLKQNNDVMRGKLLQAIAERDHYLARLKQHGVDPGTPPVVAVAAAVPPVATASNADDGADGAASSLSAEGGEPPDGVGS